ncbi:hypothetical protein [Pseudooceanicola aestuarii]|uniref:hypothetical protein n=1 Tax=Pseudooceanicola aestuarii TaxID=2697319 RepID=UPI0013D03279|nr:hypothetical protein [Pseudooceanicola aestuarii]
MLIDGQTVFSRPTLVAGRTLLSTVAIVIIIDAYGLDLSGLELLGVPIPAEKLNGPLAWGIGLLLLSYAVNWFTDVLSYVGWNSGERVQKQSVWGGGKAEALQTKLANLIWSLSSTAKEVETDIKAGKAQSEAVDDLKGAVEQLSEIKRGISRLRLVGGLFVYVWHGLVPLGATAWAMCILLRIH